MFEPSMIINRICLYLVPLWFSLSVHEWAHAYSAFLLGDDTASLQGRVTMNPLAHIHPIGTFLLPLLGIPFGWAKPVPVNPTRFLKKYNMRWGMMLTALAGPISNILLAILFGLIYRFIFFVNKDIFINNEIYSIFLFRFVYLNIILAAFNLIPVPPLDGSRVADYFMPESYRSKWEKIYHSGPIFLFILIMLLNILGGQLFYPFWILAHRIIGL